MKSIQTLVLPAGDVLRQGIEGLRDPRQVPSLRWSLACIAIVSPIYGFAMGSFNLDLSRTLYPLFSACKLPIMIFATSLLCLPGYFALSTVLGLRNDLHAALRAIVSSQAAFTLTLASLATFTLFLYANGITHRAAILVNGFMFLVATAVAQAILRKHYAPLLARSRKHAFMLCYWLVAYVFVGVQMGWMLRPFIGTPGIPPTFFRAEPFSNAYIVVLRLIFPGS